MAIISVLLLHTTLPYAVYTLYLFHINQAVPVFMVITGITLMITFKKSTTYKTFIDYYNKTYLEKKFSRIICPFLIIFIISLIFGILKNDYYIGRLSLIGYLPVTGPGNYYITILLEFTLIAPLLAYLYKRSPKLLLTSMILLDLAFELTAPYIWIFSNNSYLYKACILRYFSAIALGIFISDDFLKNGHINLKEKKYRLILLILPVSIVYLIAGTLVDQPFPLFEAEWGTQNIISYAYTLVITVLLLNLDAKMINNSICKLLILLGKASYHIFLAQILFFGFGLSFIRFENKNNVLITGSIAVVLNILTTIFLGLIFYYIEPKITNSIVKQIKSLINNILLYSIKHITRG